MSKVWCSKEARVQYWNMRLQAIWVGYESNVEAYDALEVAKIFKKLSIVKI